MKRFKILFALFACTASIAHADPAPSESYKETYVEITQGKLFCRVIGQGEPLIVIHGGPGLSQDYLLPSMARLAKNHQVIFYDQRGCGKSQLASIDNDLIKIDFFVHDIETIRKSLGFNKITLIGHSWGGHLAMHYAIRHPNNVEKLVLMNSTASNSDDFKIFLEEFGRRMSPYMEEFQQIKRSPEYAAGDTETVVKYLKTMFRPYCFRPESADKLNLKFTPAATLNGNKVYEVLRRNYLIQRFDLRPDLSKLTCKTLIIHGDADPAPLQTAQNTQKAIPNAQLLVLEECGHFPYVEKPDQFFYHLNAFLKDR